MENLIIKATEDTPEINFKTDGNLLIKGISVPENVLNFYAPVNQWLDELKINIPKCIVLVFEIEYINTSSARVLIDLIKKVVLLKEICPDFKIVWRYEKSDDDNLDLGKDLEYSSKTVFEFQQK